MKNLKTTLENFVLNPADQALARLFFRQRYVQRAIGAQKGGVMLLITVKHLIAHLFCSWHILNTPSVLRAFQVFSQPRSMRFGIMVEKYPKTPGKLSTLSTMIYKQIVDNLLSLGKREVDKP